VSLLKATDLSKSYAGVTALKSVSFELERGEVRALIGENGAGKSTLIKILTGAVQPDSGVVELEGRPVIDNNPHLSRALGIVAIYQQPSLFPDLTVAENIALATEKQTLWRRVDWRARRIQARELLARVGSDIDPDAEVSTLGMPQQQIVEIAKALGTNAKVLILDEPTASLTEREVQNLFRVLRELRAHGVGLIYISHRLEEITEIADRVTVLRDGSLVETRSIQDVSREELIRLMVGRELAAVFPKREVALGDVVLELRGRVNLTVRAGEIVGLAGLVGAGRTELAETLFGLRPAQDLEVLLRSQRVQINSARQAVELGIAYVPEDRRRHGLIMEMPIAANLTLADLDAIATRGLLNFARERKLAWKLKEELSVKTVSIDIPVDRLSGGNQQKVVIGRWLATNPAVLILDEPTQGVDVGAKSEIHRIMGELAGRGLAILMISSEMPEILGMSDRIAVMRGGRIEGIVNRREATQQRVLALALGTAA
jgi:rhamnose transport system ATP-binding protein